MVPNAKKIWNRHYLKPEEELNTVLEDNIEHQKITNLNFQIGFLVSSEAAEDELLQKLPCTRRC